MLYGVQLKWHSIVQHKMEIVQMTIRKMLISIRKTEVTKRKDDKL